MLSFLEGLTPSSLKTTSTSSTSTTKNNNNNNDNKQTINLVIIIPNQKDNWKEIFSNCTLNNGKVIEIFEVMWNQFVVATYPESQGCYLHLNNGKTIHPDFLLIRSEVRGVTIEQDFRNSLFGLIYGNVPSVNSLHSIYCFLERPIIQGELNRLQNTLGSDVFPVVEQSYFSTHRSLMYGSSFPAVVKVGHAHAGYGKMKIEDHHVMEDFQSVLALSNSYMTAEPFIEGSFDLRIQKIGSHYRVFRRYSVSGAWKTNTGSSHIEEVELTPQYKRWADEACQIFGGLDICTVDAIHDSKTGKEIIMEVNGTSSGLSPTASDEDNQYIKELVLEKMNLLFT